MEGDDLSKRPQNVSTKNIYVENRLFELLSGPYLIRDTRKSSDNWNLNTDENKCESMFCMFIEHLIDYIILITIVIDFVVIYNQFCFYLNIYVKYKDVYI